MFSKVIRWDIGYLDARKRMNELRKAAAGN